MSLSSKLSKPKPSSIQTLLKSGFTPTLQDLNTFLLLLLLLSQPHKKFKFTTHFFSQMTSNYINGDSFTHSIFIRSLLSQRKYEAAAQFIKNQMGNVPICRKNRFFDSIIQGLCVDRKDAEKGLLVLQDCLKIEGALPSSFTFRYLIHSFSNLGKMSRAIEVLDMMADEKIRYPFDNFVFSSVICGFVNVGEDELEVGFFENAVKAAYLKPNIVTYTAVLGAYCRLGRVGEISQLVSRIEKDGLMFDVVFYSSWIFRVF